MTKPHPSTGPKISELLNEMASAMLELDAGDKSKHIRYTDEDVMNAVHIFSHVLSNMSIHRMMDDGEDIVSSMQKMIVSGEKISEIVKYMTDIDTKEFYKKDETA